MRNASSTEPRSPGEISPMWRVSRSLATARIWSTTATTRRPEQTTGTNNGGAACGALDRGTTTTVRRRSLSTLVPTTKQGLVFLISDPRVGSSRTHQTSPRRGVIPGLRRFALQPFKFLFNGPHLTAAIGHFRRASQHAVTFPQTSGEGFGDVSRAFAGRDTLDKLSRQGSGQTEGHFSCRHNSIIP